MEPIILLHGALGAMDQLEPLANALKNHFDVHQINFSGHGGNPFPRRPFSIEMFAEDVLDYMHQHRMENANLFGYSMGGYVGMYLAKRFPGEVSAVITLATKFYWDETVAAKETKLLDPTTIEQKIPAFAKELELRHAPQDWKQLLAYTKDLLVGLGQNNVLQLSDYTSISTPCLLMLGDRDKMVTLEETVNVYKQLSGCFICCAYRKHPIQ
jgi:pimeloyl-ACP methyl ester carboxylesterase